MTQTTTYNVIDLIYDNGIREILILTNNALSGKKRSSYWKKKVIKSDKIATFTIKIKTK